MESTARNKDDTTSKFDASKALKALGTTLLLITAALIWKEVSVDAVYLLLGGSAVTMGASFILERKRIDVLGPLFAFGSLLVAGGWYGATRDPLAIGGLAMTFVSFAGMSWLHRVRSPTLHRLLAFQGLAWSTLVLTMATDFHLFHGSELGDDSFLARRVILTIGWLVPGLALLVIGGKREDRAFQAAGLVFGAAALGKLLFYDTTQLDGVLRIASYGLAGLLTLVAGSLLTRKPTSTEVSS